MKRLVAILLCVFMVTGLGARNKVFCEIIEQAVSRKKTRIYLDYGQPRNRAKEIRLANERGEAEIFSSRVEALNLMSALGWKFEQVYVKVTGSQTNGSGSTASTTHYLMSKEVDSIGELDGLTEEIVRLKSLRNKE